MSCMSKEIALYIKALRTESPIHSWRMVSKLVCEKYPHYVMKLGEECEENQLLGIDLCEMAAEVLDEIGADWV